MLSIPLRSDLPFFDVQAVLDGVTYTLEFRWNTREGFWYMHILTEGGDPILMGIKCVVAWPLARRTPDPRRPLGVLSFIDTGGGQVDPSYDPATGKGDLGDRVQLLYFEAAELPAA